MPAHAQLAARAPDAPPAPDAPTGAPHRRAYLGLKAGVASIWLATGLLVLHPFYRAEGARYLAPLGLGEWVMWATCAGEVMLGLWLLTRPQGRLLAALQVGAMATFTLILAVSAPTLLAHPLGVLSKNLPIVAGVLAVAAIEREGWSLRARGLLRFGAGVIWVTEGLIPKLLFPQRWELDFVAWLGVPGEPLTVLQAVGAAQVAAGVSLWTLRGRWLGGLAWTLALMLVLLPGLVVAYEPHWLAHPFGPLTKNLPAFAVTLALWRCSSRS